MQIRKTEPGDLPEALAIYKHAREFMAENGNPRQWNTTWPPEELIRHDIETGKSYVCVEEEERILAVFYYDFGRHAEPAYDHIDGSWMGSEVYGVVHRIASSGKKKGVGSFCMKWAFSQCHNLRMDTHPDNRIMPHTFEKNGFSYSGIIHVPEDADPRYAYEKLS